MLADSALGDRALFLAFRWLPSCFILTWKRGKESKFSGFFLHLITPRGPTLRPHLNLITSPNTLLPNTITLWVKVSVDESWGWRGWGGWSRQFTAPPDLPWPWFYVAPPPALDTRTLCYLLTHMARTPGRPLPGLWRWAGFHPHTSDTVPRCHNGCQRWGRARAATHSLLLTLAKSSGHNHNDHPLE